VTDRPRVAIIGGGIAGLAAAHALRDRARVTVLEAAPAPGGKLRTSDVAGLAVDEGAEAFLARAPYATALAREVGLGDDLVGPAETTAAVLSRGRLRPLPSGTLLGIPTDLSALASSDVLGARGLARVPLDLVLPGLPPDDDVAVGALVAGRLGREVVDRLVDPLLGGVYAGRADALSLDATVPALAAPARRLRSLLLAARSARVAAPPSAGPVFSSLPGGLGRLTAAVVASLVRAGVAVRTGTTVRDLARKPSGWRLTTGSAASPEALEVDGVVVATPATPAARLLAPVAPAASVALAGIETASVAVVTLALPSPAVPAGLRGSGYLVPAVEGRVVKAVTFSSRKWAHLADADPSIVVVRASVGRHGEEADLQRDDADLVAVAAQELAATVGLAARPVDARVTRWGGALPQYGVGHLARVARIRSAVAEQPALAVAGASYDGVGVPACIRSGQLAAARVVESLPAPRDWPHG
jgi:oxygen-dependent protoporphyrinogen oxidase